MITASPSAGQGRVSLDGPPPLPTKTATRERSMLDAGQGNGISGADVAGNPQIQALQTAQEIESGFQKLVNIMPETQGMAAAAVAALRASIADGMAGMTGGQTGQPGQAIPPMMPPPGGGMPLR